VISQQDLEVLSGDFGAANTPDLYSVIEPSRKYFPVDAFQTQCRPGSIINGLG